MKLLVIFISLLGLFVIITSFTPSITKREQVSNKLISKSAEKMSQEHDITLIGTGGSMMYDIKMLALSFSSTKELELQEARKLVVKCVDDFLYDINTDEKIKQYMHLYPFTEKNVEIRFFFRKKNGQDIAAPKIANISSFDGNIIYRVNTNGPRSEQIHKETFKEAKNLLNKI